MYKFVEDPENEKACKECACNIKSDGKPFDAKCGLLECVQAEKDTNKNCFADKGYYIREDK